MQDYNDASDSGSSQGGGGLPVVVASAPAVTAGTTGKRRVIKRTKPSESNSTSLGAAGGASTSYVDPNAGPSTAKVDADGHVQVVQSEQEADALVRRIRQLEQENTSLARTLAKVCDENANLTGVVAKLESKVSELAHEPLKQTSVLHSLFEPEKTGWFGGSKSAARDQLEKLSAALQAEFLEYKAAHVSSNDEVQAILAAMQSASVNAAEVADIVKQQQQSLAEPPYVVTVRVVPYDQENGTQDMVSALRGELLRQQARVSDAQLQLQRTSDDLRDKCSEVIKLQSDIKDLREQGCSGNGAAGLAAAGSAAASYRAEVEWQKAKDENARLSEQLQQLRQSLAAEERMHAVKRAECDALQRTLDTERSTRSQQSSSTVPTSPALCSRCDGLRVELERAKAEAAAALEELTATRAQLAQVAASGDTRSADLQARLIQTQTKLAEQQSLVQRSVPQTRYSTLEAERDTLAHELELARQRVSSLEQTRSTNVQANPQSGEAEPMNLSDTVILSTLEHNKERISRLESERDQLRSQLQQAQAYAVTRDQEAQRLERATAEDKQRVAFLVKKCANVTADLRAATVARDAMAEEASKHQVEIKQLQRQVENAATVQKRYDELVKEKAQMEARLASVEELEEKLVKAKETIAYMELSQSKTINMSQYAEMQAAKEKLENTMAPMKKKLEEANKEIERLRAVTDAQQMVTGNQQSSVQNIQDQLNAATAAEAKLRDKVATLSAENERLQMLNTSLEAQMTDMQDGIKEMAMQMEGLRTSATTKAEASSQRQVEELRAQLDKATAELARVQATTGQFVAEGLYQNACSERDRLADENKKKGFEFEKMKSEILIYRQTIADLEAENDEHVKEIEALQDRFQNERASLSERLSEEQKRVAELSTQCESQREELSAKDAKLEQAAATTKEMQELQAKQRRAFEEKCAAEERLSAQVASLQATNVALQSTYEQKLADARATGGSPSPSAAAVTAVATPVAPAAAAPPQPAALPASDADADAAKVTSDRLYRLQCDNDRLSGELRRAQLRHRAETDDSQRLIQVLQMQVKARMPADTRTAYEAEIRRSTALRSSNEELLKENEQLRKQIALAPAVLTTGTVSGSAPGSLSTSLPSNAGDLQAQLLQLQQQMKVQKSSFDAAMSHAVAEDKAKQRRIEELEAELHEQCEAAGENDRDLVTALTKPSSLADGIDGVGGEDEAGAAGSGGVSPRPKKKVKKVKKKRSLAEQVAGVDPMTDVLVDGAGAAGVTGAESSGLPPLPLAGSTDASKKLQLQAQLVEADLVKARQELELLRKENATLKETIAQLTTDLTSAQQDLDEAHAAMDEERNDFEKRIYALEAHVKELQDNSAPIQRSGSLASGADLLDSKSSGRQKNMQDTEMQLRSVRDENDKLKQENRQLKNDLAKAASSPASTPSAAGARGKELKQLQVALKQKDAEIGSLASQLMPTKNKLAEYMAMADRLGLQYPFPPQLEGPTVVRLRALNIQAANRATSAPMAPAAPATVPAVDSSPAPRPPPDARRFTNPRTAAHERTPVYQQSRADAFQDLR